VSWSDYVERCRRHDPSKYSPLWIAGAWAGRVPHQFDEALERAARGLLRRVKGDWRLEAQNPREASRLLGKVVEHLVEEGRISALSGELYWLRDLGNGRKLGWIDRAAATWFGIRTRGAHLNGYTRSENGVLRMWLARRALTSASFPGRWDNLAAGGLAAGASPWTCLRNEAAAEAGIDAPLIDAAEPVSRLSYCVDTDDGLVDVEMFVFDLEVPPSFAPSNRDGTVDRFLLASLGEAEQLALVYDVFKDNSGLVLLDFLMRHGRCGSLSC
jgi:hypothetical protein